MKFLDLPDLREAATVLNSGADLGDVVVEGVLEAYSCKAVKDDKKLLTRKREEVENFKKMSSPKLAPVIRTSTSPPAMDSPLGPIDTTATLRLLVNLISTLNNSFPDYNFNDVSARHFKLESMQSVVSNIDHLLLNANLEKQNPGFRSRFWRSLDSAVQPSQCEVYQFAPSDDSDLYVGKLWTMFYFFFNRRKSRIVLLAVSAVNKMRTPQLGALAGVGEMEYDDTYDVMDDLTLRPAAHGGKDRERKDIAMNLAY